MEWETGAKMRILNADAIINGEGLTDGEIYEVISIDTEGLPVIETEEYSVFEFLAKEMQYVERVLTAVDYAEIARRAELGSYGLSDVERNAELGQPSESCECDYGTIAEELADIKAMIGRLLRNGEES